MALSSGLNWVFVVMAFVCLVPGCALLWRVFDASSLIANPMQRLAQYEACGFIFFWAAIACTVFAASKDKMYNAFQAIAIGILLYITIFSKFMNFTVLNNLRVVDMSGNNDFFLPSNLGAPLDRGNQQKYLGGLILAWLSLFFGLIACAVGEFKKPSSATIALWVFALILLVTGNVVCWSSDSASTYNITNYTSEINLFFITTLVMVQWLVLTLGVFQHQKALLGSSAFIFGVVGVFIPINYFTIQDSSPGNADFLWAGPVLCWFSSWVMAAAAAVCDDSSRCANAEAAKKEASV